MQKFTLINKNRSRIKVFEPFEDISKPSPTIDAMIISYGCVYKRSSKPVMKGSRVESIDNAREEYKKLLKEGWKKTSLFQKLFLLLESEYRKQSAAITKLNSAEKSLPQKSLEIVNIIKILIHYLNKVIVIERTNISFFLKKS